MGEEKRGGVGGRRGQRKGRVRVDAASEGVCGRVVVVWAEREADAEMGLVPSLHNGLCCFWNSHASFPVTHSGRRQPLTRCFQSGTLHYMRIRLFQPASWVGGNRASDGKNGPPPCEMMRLSAARRDELPRDGEMRIFCNMAITYVCIRDVNPPSLWRKVTCVP